MRRSGVRSSSSPPTAFQGLEVHRTSRPFSLKAGTRARPIYANNKFRRWLWQGISDLCLASSLSFCLVSCCLMARAGSSNATKLQSSDRVACFILGRAGVGESCCHLSHRACWTSAAKSDFRQPPGKSAVDFSSSPCRMGKGAHRGVGLRMEFVLLSRAEPARVRLQSKVSLRVRYACSDEFSNRDHILLVHVASQKSCKFTACRTSPPSASTAPPASPSAPSRLPVH